MVSEFHALAIMPGQFFIVAFGSTATLYPEPGEGLPVRVCRLRLSHGSTYDCKNHTGKSACATETCPAETLAPTWFKGGGPVCDKTAYQELLSWSSLKKVVPIS
jgi:hypothetical protein